MCGLQREKGCRKAKLQGHIPCSQQKVSPPRSTVPCWAGDKRSAGLPGASSNLLVCLQSPVAIRRTPALNIAPHVRVARDGLSGYLCSSQGSPCVEDDRSRKRTDGSAITAEESSLVPCQLHFIYKGRKIQPRSLFLCHATPQRPRRTHCTTNNIVRTALITGLLIHTRNLENQYRRKLHRRLPQGGDINRRASTVVYRLSTRQQYLGTQQGEIGQVREKQVAV